MFKRNKLPRRFILVSVVLSLTRGDRIDSVKGSEASADYEHKVLSLLQLQAMGLGAFHEIPSPPALQQRDLVQTQRLEEDGRLEDGPRCLPGAREETYALLGHRVRVLANEDFNPAKARLVLVLHGHGGTGPIACQTFLPHFAGDDDHILLVAPSSKDLVWENTGDMNDVSFVETLVDLHDASNNQNATSPAPMQVASLSRGVAVIGHSQGCRLIHRMLIASKRTEFVQFACFETSLDVNQYHDGTFYMEDGTVASPIHPSGRIIRFFHNEDDPVIPFHGGVGMTQEKLEFLSAEASAAAWAAAYGYSNTSLKQFKMGSVTVFSWNKNFELIVSSGGGHVIGAALIRHQEVVQKLQDTLRLPEWTDDDPRAVTLIPENSENEPVHFRPSLGRLSLGVMVFAAISLAGGCMTYHKG